MKNFGFALLGVTLVSLIFIPNLIGVAVMIILVIMIDVDLLGSIYFWGLEINSIALVNLVMAIGLVVDYSAHIIHCWFHLADEDNFFGVQEGESNKDGNTANEGPNAQSNVQAEGQHSLEIPMQDRMEIPMQARMEGQHRMSDNPDREEDGTNAEGRATITSAGGAEGNPNPGSESESIGSLTSSENTKGKRLTLVKLNEELETEITYEEDLIVARCQKTIEFMGTNILCGGCTTFLGVCCLIFAKSEIFRVFFKCFVSIVGYGVSHGLILCPILLSLFDVDLRQKEKLRKERLEKKLEKKEKRKAKALANTK